jgi:hypothetical protein
VILESECRLIRLLMKERILPNSSSESLTFGMIGVRKISGVAVRARLRAFASIRSFDSFLFALHEESSSELVLERRFSSRQRHATSRGFVKRAVPQHLIHDVLNTHDLSGRFESTRVAHIEAGTMAVAQTASKPVDAVMKGVRMVRAGVDTCSTGDTPCGSIADFGAKESSFRVVAPEAP